MTYSDSKVRICLAFQKRLGLPSSAGTADLEEEAVVCVAVHRGVVSGGITNVLFSVMRVWVRNGQALAVGLGWGHLKWL